ncbi:molecular chaperone [Tieghemiomyces parasiticus]|uniref:Molecular chaperone n=1 Tax=Tieghemiomyces parasiticus TaxID=78921 RepID=A0A9W8E1S6_9FUNG|nr:molecular chaperone [Tieghemiomyces parasiticus]
MRLYRLSLTLLPRHVGDATLARIPVIPSNTRTRTLTILSRAPVTQCVPSPWYPPYTRPRLRSLSVTASLAHLDPTTHADRSPPRKLCWKCDATLESETLVCDNQHCQALVPLSPEISYFDVLVGEETFDVEIGILRRNFLKLQQKAHPDNYSQSSPQEQKIADVHSTWLNTAYHTLRNPLARAKYILQRHGYKSDTEEVIQDPDFLTMVFDVRERLSEITDEKEADDFKLENEDRINDLVQQLSDAFSRKDYDQAQGLVAKLQYWYSTQDTLSNWSHHHEA